MVRWNSLFYIFETEGRHANAKAQEAVHHLASFPSSREEYGIPSSDCRKRGLKLFVKPECKGDFVHETESPWPSHFKHSHWCKRRSRFKFAASHYAWGTNGVCECKMDVKVYVDSYMASNGSCFMVTWTIFKKPLLGGGLNTKPGDHGTLSVHNCCLFLFYHVWGSV